MGKAHVNKALILSIASFLLICISLSFYFAPEYIEIRAQTMRVFLGTIVAAVLVYRHYKANLPFRRILVSLGAIFAAFLLLGSMLNAQISLSSAALQFSGVPIYTLHNPLVIYSSLFICWLGYCFLCTYLVQELFFLLETILTSSSFKSLGFTLSAPKCFAILLVAWFPYIIFFFPGCIPSDTSRQLAIYLGNSGLDTSNFFPWFVSIVYGSIYQLGATFDSSGTAGILLLTLIQAAVGAWVFSLVVVWVQRFGYSRLATAGLIFFALFPLIPTYVVEIGKDSLHAYVVTLFALQLFILGVRKHQNLPSTQLVAPWALAGVAVLVALTRNNGIFLSLPGLIVASILYKDRNIACAALGTLIVVLLWSRAALPALGVQPGPVQEALSIPIQVVAAQVASQTNLNPADITLAEEYLGANAQEIARSYSPLCVDPSKENARIEDASDGFFFILLAIRMGAHSPSSSLKAALLTTHEAWYPFPQGLGSLHYEHVPYTSLDNDWTLLSTWYPSYNTEQQRTDRMDPARTLLHGFRHLAPLSFLYTPGFYCWLITLCAGFAVYRGRMRRVTACVLIPFFMLELVLIAASVASLRYALPLVCALPLIVALFFFIAAPAGQDSPSKIQ